jgi:dTMP kinase
MAAISNGRGGKHLFVVIEGVDGVGKTTIAKALAERMNGVYFRTPSPTLEEFARADTMGNVIYLRQYIDQFARVSPRTRFVFYLFCVAEAVNHIRQLLKMQDVICDRFVASTLVYHRVLDPGLAAVDVAWAVELKPDHQFLLDIVDDYEHVRRLDGRLLRSDKLLEQNLAFLNTVKSEFRQLGLHTIDTTGRSVASIVGEIIDHIYDAEEIKSEKRILQRMMP